MGGGTTMKWLRLYVDVLDDPKVQRLPAPLFKVWVNLLCLTQKHGGHLPSLDDIAFALRMSESDTATALESLTERGALTIDESGGVGTAYAAFPSDRDAWIAVRAELTPLVFARDEHCCVYCGATEDLTVDHVLPISRGGTNDLSNLVTACRPCNSSKNAKTPEEWEAARR